MAAQSEENEANALNPVAGISDETKDSETRSISLMSLSHDNKRNETESSAEFSYIMEHADKSRVGNMQGWHLSDYMPITTTLADGTYATNVNGNIDTMWTDDDDGDDVPDGSHSYLGGDIFPVSLYGNPEDDTQEWLVGKATVPAADRPGIHVTDYQHVRNDNNGTRVDGIEYDDETGLVYVPKSAIAKDSDGKWILGSNRLQVLMRKEDPYGGTFSFPVSVTSDGADDIAQSGKATTSATNQSIRIQVQARDAKNHIAKDNIDEIKINGTPYESSVEYENGEKADDAWSYDERTGILTIYVGPANITSVSIHVSDNENRKFSRTLHRIESLFVPEAKAAQRPNTLNGTFEFAVTPDIGWEEYLNGDPGQGTNSGDIKSRLPRKAYAVGDFELKMLDYIVNYQNYTDWYKTNADGVPDGWRDGYDAITRNLRLWVQKTGNTTVTQESFLGLQCNHSYKEVGNPWQGHNVFMKIIKWWNAGDGTGSALVGIIIPYTESSSQAGAGYFGLTWRNPTPPPAQKGKLHLTKTLTTGKGILSQPNAYGQYSLQGAEYTIYKATGNADQYGVPQGVGASVGTITTNANGYAESGDLDVGYYWVRETKAPTGTYLDRDTSNTYVLNGSAGYYPCYVEANQSAALNTLFKGQTRDGTVKDVPKLGSIGVRKTSSRDGSSLSGAEFGIWIDGVAGPYRTMTTNSRGIGRVDNLALGTYWIHETKAPAGHTLKTTGGVRASTNSLTGAYNDSGWFKVTVKENPYLYSSYADDIVTWVTTSGNNFVDDAIPQGGFSINKIVTDPDTGSTMSRTYYSPAGARFKVVGPGMNGSTRYVTVDSTGSADLDDLEYGTYYITEVSAPTDGHSILDGKTYTVNVSSTHKNFTWTAENEARKYSFTIAKQSDTAGDTGKLSGAQFGVYKTQSDANSGRNAIETITIGSNNRGQSGDNYTLGQTVYLKETKAPDGYKLNTQVFTVTVNANETTVKQTITDEKIKTPFGKLRIIKTDSADGASFAGAKFKIISTEKVVGTDGKTYATPGKVMQEDLTTNAQGIATSIDLPLNANGSAFYQVVETYAPAPYQLADPVSVHITGGTVNTVVSQDVPVKDTPSTGKVRIKKLADGTNTGIAGVKFNIVATKDIVMPTGKTKYKAGDVVQKDIVTGDDGTAESNELPIGKDGKGYYKVVETYAPKPYIISTTDTDATISLNAADPTASYADVVVKDKLPTGTIKVIKKDFTTGDVIPSVEFDVKAKSDVMGADGSYLAHAGDTVAHLKTKADGTDTTGELPIGRDGQATYTLTETKAAALYPISTTTWDVTLAYENSTKAVIAGQIEIKNTKEDLFGTVKVIKVGSQDKEPIPGVKFDVIAAKDHIGFDGKTKATAGQVMQKDLTTQEDGTATSVKLPLDRDGKGYYKLVETYAPSRYEIIATETPFTIDYATDAKETTANKEVTVENKKRPVIDGKIRVTKTDSDTAEKLAGAVFEVTAKSDVTMPDGTVQATAGSKVATIKTEADGIGISGDLPLTSTDWVNWSATYTVTETQAPNGHSITAQPKDVTITGKGSGEGASTSGTVTVDVAFEDSPIPHAKITVRKTDKEDGGAIPGAKFNIVATKDMVNHDGTVKVKSGTIVQADLTTGADGTATSDALKVGDDGKGWYKIVETFTPKPYYLDKTEWDANLSWDGKTFGKDVTVAVDAQNVRASGKVKVTKVDDNNDPVRGVKFDVVAVDDITLPNGKVVAPAGKVVIHDLTTGDDGTATAEPLPMDKSGSTKYKLVETFAPSRYEITNRETEVTITYKDMQTAVVTVESKVENHKYPVVDGKLKISKVESGTTKGLDGAVFEVVAKTDMKMPDGTIQAHAGEKVATLTIVSNGSVESEALPLNSTDWKTWAGTYTVTETKAPNGHFISDGPKDVTITAESGQGKPTVVEQSVTFEDDVVPPARITVRKTDKDGGKGIPGTKFDIVASKDMLKADGTVKVTKGTKVQTDLITGDDGAAESQDIQIGDDGNGWYQVIETFVPKPYLLDATPHEVELHANQSTEAVTGRTDVSNVAQHGRIRLEKTDKVKGRPVKGAKFDVIATKDVRLPTGEVKFSAGDTVQHDITTGDDGTATSDELPLGDDGIGHYKVVETYAPAPYVRGTEWDATITGGGTDKVVTVNVKVDDDIARATLKLTKVATDDGKPIPNAVFDIVADEDITLPDGTTLYAKDAKVETVKTKEDGTITTTQPLYVGKDGKGQYRADEVSVPVPYVITTKSTKFTASYADDATLGLSVEVTVKNDTNALRLTKTELVRDEDGTLQKGEDAKPVPGAEYRIWRKGDELLPKPENGKVAYALRVDGGKGDAEVALVPRCHARGDAHVPLQQPRCLADAPSALLRLLRREGDGRGT